MPSLSETVVRDWLEHLGFLVCQPRKYQVVARAKRPEEEPDLLGWNPAAAGPPPEPGVWTGSTLRRVKAVAVGVKGWFTERFGPSAFQDSAELLRLGAPDVRRAAARRLGADDVVAVLCLPALPASAELRRRTLEILTGHGIAGVVLFRTVLVELAAVAGRRLDYDRSDVLQLLRMVRASGLLRDPQPELFRVRPARRRATTRPERGAARSENGGP
ncbi:MAG: hypothetical protein N2652_06465 [Kiritimatiellae bacterium]|nr:hypothetical protein [Kiritimatiellia bacterium]